ncbi:MAG TPA: HAMP domain-containing sensor histidine kinase [Nodosilinea sp.]|nr:HAMP domain-containing sensor histidine kinase [Nodosilinea sp.]
MIGSPSSEFIALCQAQVLLLTQALGAASTVVYLAEAAAESLGPALVPLVAYPESADLWRGLREGLAAFSDSGEAGVQQTPGMAQPGGWWRSPGRSRQPSAAGLAQPYDLDGVQDGAITSSTDPMACSSRDADRAAYPLVLPLTHDGVVLGMMVSTREALPWRPEDYKQAEQVASSLAIACVMDQRSQWLQRQLSQRQLSQADQSETFHDLLHQFRNPLTALQTFGKLMVKRLPPEDTNRPIAEGIVRESRRLQDLTEHFDAAVALGDEALTQAKIPSAGSLLLPGTTSDSESDNGADLSAGGMGDDLGGGVAIAPPQGHGLGRSLSLRPGAIAEVAMPLVQITLPLAQDRHLHLVHHIPVSLPDVWLDPGALGEVLHNLLDNALKYAPPGALVWVTAGLVQRRGNQVFQGIAVGDTGMGIPPVDQPQIFTRHFRGVQVHSQIPGTGLGLAIVQDLVEGMGGHIDLISPVQDTPWLPPEAAAFPKNPGVLFVVWLRVAAVETLPLLETPEPSTH